MPVDFASATMKSQSSGAVLCRPMVLLSCLACDMSRGHPQRRLPPVLGGRGVQGKQRLVAASAPTCCAPCQAQTRMLGSARPRPAETAQHQTGPKCALAHRHLPDCSPATSVNETRHEIKHGELKERENASFDTPPTKYGNRQWSPKASMNAWYSLESKPFKTLLEDAEQPHKRFNNARFGASRSTLAV